MSSDMAGKSLTIFRSRLYLSTRGPGGIQFNHYIYIYCIFIRKMEELHMEYMVVMGHTLMLTIYFDVHPSG